MAHDIKDLHLRWFLELECRWEEINRRVADKLLHNDDSDIDDRLGKLARDYVDREAQRIRLSSRR